MLPFSEHNRTGPQRCFCGRYMAKVSGGWRCSLEVPVERGWLWEHL